MCQQVFCAFLSFRSHCRVDSQTCLREQGNGEQHVTDPFATFDSMLRLLRTLAFCLWCSLLLHRQAVADEEAAWGPTQKPPKEKQGWLGIPNPFSRIPFPSIPFPRNPFYSGSNDDNKAVLSTTTTETLTEPTDLFQENLGSGDGGISVSSKPTTTSTQEFPTSVTEIRTETLPTGTSDSPHSITAQSNNDTLVLDSSSPTSSSIRNTLFTNNPTSTSSPEQNATHTLPPESSTQAARPSMGATTQHLPEEHTDQEEAEEISSTIAPETTVPTALTWAEAQTITTIPGLVETTLLRHTPRPVTTAPTSPETTSDKKPQDTTLTITLHAEEATLKEFSTTQSEAELGFSEARSGLVEVKPGVITTAMGINRELVPESITRTSQSQWVNFSTAGGKQT